MDSHDGILKLCVLSEMAFTVARLRDLPGSCCTSPLPLGMAPHQCKADLKAEWIRGKHFICSYESWSAVIQTQLKTVGFLS